MEPKRAIPSQENGQQRMVGAVSDDERLSLYCEALLADPHITMLQILNMQHPLEVAHLCFPGQVLSKPGAPGRSRMGVLDCPTTHRGTGNYYRG
jgi:hypothetical protein